MFNATLIVIEAFIRELRTTCAERILWDAMELSSIRV